MKCHPLRWVWGLIPLAIFSWIAALSIKDTVERDLGRRVLDQLTASSLGWAKVRFDGRDGTLSGLASDEGEPSKAIQLGNGVYGVRILDGQADLLRKVEPYIWSAASADNKITLTGFVPNETARKSIVAAIKSQFPKSELTDKLEYARGNPPASDWLDGARFGLKQLAGLKGGRADMSGLDLSVSGEAATAVSYKDVKSALVGSLPKGVKLASDKVTAPRVSPYAWSAKLAGNAVALTGYVPNERVRDQLMAHGKQAFGKTAIVDRMEFADGAHEGWEKAVKVSLDQLATLQEGAAELKGGILTLSGLAADEPTAETARAAFKSQVPGSIKTADSIKSLKTTISPYTTSIDATSTAIDVTGYVPSDASRAALISTIKTRLPGRAVNDRLQIGAGEPAGYDACLMSALSGLGRLNTGRVSLTDKQVLLTGVTTDEAVASALSADVKAAAKGACDTAVTVTLDDSRKRKAQEDADRARKDAEDAAAAKARRDAELAANAAAAEAKRLATEAAAANAAAAAEAKVKTAAASACETELRNARNAGLVQFERASDVLLRQSQPTLRQLAQIANKCENVLIEIEGHTDSEGIPERNQPLSERRAQSVVDFLVEAGVNAARIKAIGYGDTKPIAPNDTAENRAKNRRIEFSVKTK